MFSQNTRIFIDERELDSPVEVSLVDSDFKLDSGTSVSKLKRHFFETLSEIGEICKFRREGHEKNKELALALSSPNTFVASFHELPAELPCRLLQHTKGGLMLTGGFLSGWTFRQATMNLVETVRQKKQMEKGLGKVCPVLGVFAQNLATDLFRMCSMDSKQRAKTKLGVSPNELHLLYAGRFIPNKGLLQLIRALELWPISRTRLTMIGDFETDFQISQSGGDCSLFESYFHREGLRKTFHLNLKLVRSVKQDALVPWFHSADAFLYPSFHEDEASGNAAHEAVLAGLPAIVTDWCGLGQLGLNTRGGAIQTYATLGGVRYSLRSLRDQIANLPKNPDLKAAENDSQWVKSTFDPKWMRASLENATVSLLNRSVGSPPKGGWRCPSRLEPLTQAVSPELRKAATTESTFDPEGLYVDGLGYKTEKYSEARLLYAIQSLYTTYSKPPELQPGDLLHGFWRVALIDNEKALIEFGFPGPRLLRFNASDWNVVLAATKYLSRNEIEFTIRDEKSARILQSAVDLGYLVPHQFGSLAKKG